MYEWNEAIQRMIDWIDENITEGVTLQRMSQEIGYSPYYCSSQFHQIVGLTLKSYVAGQRLSKAAMDIRDTDERILDIAIKYGFSSQQTLTRAFQEAYRCTPAFYRKSKGPIPLAIKKQILFPEYYKTEGERKMEKTVLTEARVRVEYIPAHKFLAVWEKEAESYFALWEKHNCDEVCGTIESLSNIMEPMVPCHTAGWFFTEGKRGYCYGLGVPEDYSGEIPGGFELRAVPGSYYLVFYHPAFDFLKDCEDVMERVEALAESFNPRELGFRWKDSTVIYQKQMPETIGYEVLKPVERLC